MSQVKTDKSTKSIETTKMVYPMVKEYYGEANKVAQDHSKKLCYVTGAGLVDLCWVYEDVLPLFPENFNAACAAKQMTPPLLEIAEGAGYARELCGYFRNHTGYLLEGKDKEGIAYPGGGLAIPDFLIADSGSCYFHLKWWRETERLLGYKIPCYLIDVPYIAPRMTLDDLEAHYLDYTVKQIKGALEFIGRITGKELDKDRLREVVRLSGEASALFEEMQNLRKAVPSPMGSEDALSCLMPLVQWAGTQQAVDFARALRDEVKARVDAGKGVLENEKLRILFDNIPPWFSLGLFNYLHKFDAVSVIESYTYFFHYSRGRMDPDKPYESLARKYLYGCWFMTSVRETVHSLIARKAIDFKVDGIISYALYGCKIATGFLPYQAKIMQEKYGIPTLLLEGDMVDPRDYADGPVKNRVDAFMEMLLERKNKKS